MIGLTVDAGDHFKKRAAIPLAPCMYQNLHDQNYKTIKLYHVGEKCRYCTVLYSIYEIYERAWLRYKDWETPELRQNVASHNVYVT
jgi:hypothetical protein